MIGVKVDVKIDTSSLDKNFDKEIEEVVDTLADLARAHWIQLAGETFKTTATEYVNGIQPVEKEDSTTASISLLGFLPNALENGLQEFDMKEGLLKNSKQSKSGSRYKSIRFEKGSPTQSAIPSLPTDTFQRVKVLAPGTRLHDSTPPRTNTRGYTHKSSIFEGLAQTKMEKSSRFVAENYRTVSSNSDASSWIHPGLRKRSLMEKVKMFVEEQLASILKERFS